MNNMKKNEQYEKLYDDGIVFPSVGKKTKAVIEKVKEEEQEEEEQEEEDEEEEDDDYFSDLKDIKCGIKRKLNF